MATCPKCQQAMPMTATICPHCGYDFPTRDEDFLREIPFRGRAGFAYSSLAEFALFIGMIIAVVSAAALLVATISFLLGKGWTQAFATFVAFWLQLALYVVFQRVSDMK